MQTHYLAFDLLIGAWIARMAARLQPYDAFVSPTVPVVAPHYKSGRLKVYGIISSKRSPLMPDIPTFAEQGIDVTSGEGWTGMWARAGTPAADIERMQKAVQQVLQMPEVKEQMSQRLWVQPRYRGGAEMDALQRAELAHWEPIIKASGFKAE